MKESFAMEIEMLPLFMDFFTVVATMGGKLPTNPLLPTIRISFWDKKIWPIGRSFWDGGSNIYQR